ALFLKTNDEKIKKKGFLGRFFDKFNIAFSITTDKYTKSLRFLYRHKWMTWAFLAASVVGIIWASNTTPTGFVPDEDRGLIFANIELPAGASLDRTVEATNLLGEKMRNIPGISGFSLVNGFSIISGAGSNYGISFIRLDPWGDRKDDDKTVEAITAKLFGAAATIPDAKIIFFQPPSVPGFGASSGFEAKILDRSGGRFNDLSEVTQNYLRELSQRPAIMYAQPS